MTDQLPDRLADELAVCEASTQGPWLWESRQTVDGDQWCVYDAENDNLAWNPNGWGPDAEFIAAARTALPAALRALQAVMGLHRREVRTARMTYHCGHCGDTAGWPCPTIQKIQEVYGDE